MYWCWSVCAVCRSDKIVFLSIEIQCSRTKAQALNTHLHVSGIQTRDNTEEKNDSRLIEILNSVETTVWLIFSCILLVCLFLPNKVKIQGKNTWFLWVFPWMLYVLDIVIQQYQCLCGNSPLEARTSLLFTVELVMAAQYLQHKQKVHKETAASTLPTYLSAIWIRCKAKNWNYYAKNQINALCPLSSTSDPL